MKKTDEFYKKMNFNDLKKLVILRRYFPLFTAGTSMAYMTNIFVKSFSGTFESKIAIFYLASLLSLNFVDAILPKNVKGSDTKDVQKIKEIYDDVLKEYCKLHDIFGFNHPVEMYDLFVVAYYQGYLSNNHVYQYNNVGVIDLECLKGVNVINGNGVCRHVSAMLKDIYCNVGVENIILGVTTNLDLDYSNHIINTVICDNECFYFVPTQIRWYEKQSEDLLIDLLGMVKIQIQRLNEVKNPFSVDYIINNILSKPSLKTSVDIEKGLNAQRTVFENLDILEKFYNENKEKYVDIADKILVLKKGNSDKRIVDF